jgi:pyrimidine and pyridine-specific 5'-nucleotidase
MTELIDQYFIRHLELTREDAYKLHQDYYTTYGLAIEGLVRHHKIDPMEYNSQVDDALPLESIIFPDPELRKLLEDMDKTKVKLWLFTNAYLTHGQRVVRLLGVEDMFEGITYCDYAQSTIICKPHSEMYAKAMKEAGITESQCCYFVGKLRRIFELIQNLRTLDDSALNCRKAEELGWTSIHLVEEGEPLPTQKACKYQIRHLEDLRSLFPQFFKR